MANKHQVIAAHREHPDWTAGDIATHLGCDSGYVRATAQRNRLTLARARQGRISIRLSALLAGLDDEAARREKTVAELAHDLLAAIARDGLTNAVLDDGMAQ